MLVRGAFAGRLATSVSLAMSLHRPICAAPIQLAARSDVRAFAIPRGPPGRAASRGPCRTPPAPVLVASSIEVLVGLAVRASSGAVPLPVAAAFGWPRSDASFATAITYLASGFGQPISGAPAEKIGDRKAVVLRALCCAAGLVPS